MPIRHAVVGDADLRLIRFVGDVEASAQRRLFDDRRRLARRPVAEEAVDQFAQPLPVDAAGDAEDRCRWA